MFASDCWDLKISSWQILDYSNEKVFSRNSKSPIKAQFDKQNQGKLLKKENRRLIIQSNV